MSTVYALFDKDALGDAIETAVEATVATVDPKGRWCKEKKDTMEQFIYSTVSTPLHDGGVVGKLIGVFVTKEAALAHAKEFFESRHDAAAAAFDLKWSVRTEPHFSGEFLIDLRYTGEWATVSSCPFALYPFELQ